MYITCKQCDTTFRLDEKLVKATGSRARCCQCREVFVIYPPEPAEADSDALAMEAAPQAVSEAALDQELEGIDLAELDSILDQDGGVGNEAPDESVAVKDAETDEGAAELDESDLDLDFTLEPEGEEQQPEQAQEAAVDMAADDLDIEMDFELNDGLDDDAEVAVDQSEIEAEATEAPVADVPPTEEELEMELDQLDLSLDEDEPTIEEPAAVQDEASEEPDLMDEDVALEEDELMAEAPETADQELELPSDDDEQPGLELVSEEPAGDAAEPEADADDLDLSDLDAVLGLEQGSEQAPLDFPESTDEEDLELSLDDDFDTATDELSNLELDDEPESGVEEELELETASGDSDVEAPTDTEDELDMSDLDTLLSDVPDDSEAVEDGDESLDLELELDDDTVLAETAGDDLEDLSFELDSEFEDEPDLEQLKKNAESAVDDEEIDFSDIEQMLEGDTAATAGLAGESAEAADESGGLLAGEDELGLDGGADEIDLTEIEAAIDAADKAADEEISFEEELSLDDSGLEPKPELEPDSKMDLDLDELVLEGESDASTVDVEPVAAADGSDELDLSDIGDLVEDQAASTTTEVIDSDDIELEFEVSDAPTEQAAEDSQTAQAVAPDPESTLPLEETVLSDTVMQEVELESEPGKEKRSGNKGLLFLLLILLLGGAAYLFYAVSSMGFEIPYLSSYLNPKPKDPTGILNLATLDINSKFIENELSGRLFVVTGKVRNGKDTSRRLIRLQGKLFTKGKVLSKTEFTYAGVNFKDQEISQQAVGDIKKKINNPNGPAAAVKVLSGQTVPFMIVFSDLPEGLDEFAIEVISSMQAK
jgi:predicted Zn finger-like uncharacterized protein